MLSPDISVTEFSENDRLWRLILASDINGVDKHLSVHKRVFSFELPYLNPTYEFIDYTTTSDNGHYIITSVMRGILSCDDLDKISYFVDKLVQNYNEYIISLFKTAINLYVLHLDSMLKSSSLPLYYKAVLCTVIDHIKNYINLDELVSYINAIEISLRNRVTDNRIITCDSILYLIFKMIDSDLLINTRNDILERLVLLSLEVPVSDTLTDTLLGYYTGDKDLVNYYQDSIGKYELFKKYKYVSLFEESV